MDESTTDGAPAATDGAPQTGETTQTPSDADGREPRQFDAAYVQRLRNEAATHRRDAADAKARLAALENAALSEAARTKKERDAAQAELAETKRALLRARVAARHKLPEVLAERLIGDDEQAMDADAKVLAKLVTPPASSGSAANGASGRGERQLSRDDLRSMTPSQINDARAKGLLDDLMKGQAR